MTTPIRGGLESTTPLLEWVWNLWRPHWSGLESTAPHATPDSHSPVASLLATINECPIDVSWVCNLSGLEVGKLAKCTFTNCVWKIVPMAKTFWNITGLQWLYPLKKGYVSMTPLLDGVWNLWPPSPIRGGGIYDPAPIGGSVESTTPLPPPTPWW